MKTNIPLTYTGKNADNLYVAGWKNNKPVKLRVRELDCHGSIVTDSLSYSDTIYESLTEIRAAAANGELSNNTIYLVKSGDVLVEYLYINNQLKQIGKELSAEDDIDKLVVFSKTFTSFAELKASSLSENIIYTVNDKGTLEQYIYRNDKIVQISGSLNEITLGSDDDEAKAETVEDEDGIIDYNLPELVNGSYRYKNHTNLHTVICDMPALKNGRQMFWGCPLTSFAGNLSSLEDGWGMFGKNCKLDYDSIVNIIDGLPVYDSGNHEITIGYISTIPQVEIAALELELKAKGWSVYWYVDGSVSIKNN